jgi:glycosyltransferase involved in cell wall biosynthesis
MNVLIVHNHYQHPGGEDEVFRSEAALLESRGHRVIRYTLDNASIEEMRKVRLAASAVWNRGVRAALQELIRGEAVDVIHFHNTQPLVSPGAYYAAREHGAAVVQSLHNFRLVCPNGVLFRDGHVCEDCLGRPFAWPAVVHRCYRASAQATAVTAGVVTFHRALGTWSRMVHAYIALSEFSRRKFIAGGLPPNRLHVKPNFLTQDPGVGEHAEAVCLYVGRVSPEKGLDLLQHAWSSVTPGPLLRIVGGPVVNPGTQPGVEWLGHQPKNRVYAEMRAASMLVFPSECYENCPMTIIEAFAAGLPVIVSGRGSAAEMVQDGETGLHFRAGDATDLAARIAQLLAHPETRAAMGRRAREEYERRYSGESNYPRLMQIYELARSLAQSPRSAVFPQRSPAP